jgi:hypothetical protein
MKQLWFINQPLAQNISATSQITASALCTRPASLPPCLPASQYSSQHIKCWKPYAVMYGLALLKMGTMVPETCWVIGLSINHNCCIKLVSQTISYQGCTVTRISNLIIVFVRCVRVCACVRSCVRACVYTYNQQTGIFVTLDCFRYSRFLFERTQVIYPCGIGYRFSHFLQQVIRNTLWTFPLISHLNNP